jgi:hypothetical protein
VGISARDRKRLWGKSGNRCAKCHRLLTEPGQARAAEAIIGEEAHIVGERPGAARYQPLPDRQRDAYENRILLCPTHHTIVDAQPELWTVDALLALKAAHEEAMTARTADARADGLRFDMPGAVPLDPVIGGRQLLTIVGPAYAYVFDDDPMENDIEREAAKALLQAAHDCGEIYSMIGQGDRMELAEELSEHLMSSIRAGLILYGALIEIDVAFDGERDRWPVGILHLRRMNVAAAEQHAAADDRRPQQN